MQIIIENFDDPRVMPYRNLRDRELASEGDRFIAEGKFITRRLLESDFPVESVMLAQRRVAQFAPLVGEEVPVFVVSDAMVEQIVGYKFHAGILAIGKRKASPSLDEVMNRACQAKPHGPVTLIVLPATRNAENLGSLLRIAAAFGVDGVILGKECTDPWWRRVIRVSMGSVFKLPIVRSDDLLRDLAQLHEKWQVQRIATVVDIGAEALSRARRPADPDRIALVLGPEDHGLDARWISTCDRQVTIPMQLGTDSLNVSIAAAVFLYHFTKML